MKSKFPCAPLELVRVHNSRVWKPFFRSNRVWLILQRLIDPTEGINFNKQIFVSAKGRESPRWQSVIFVSRRKKKHIRVWKEWKGKYLSETKHSLVCCLTNARSAWSVQVDFITLVVVWNNAPSVMGSSCSACARVEKNTVLWPPMCGGPDYAEQCRSHLSRKARI